MHEMNPEVRSKRKGADWGTWRGLGDRNQVRPEAETYKSVAGVCLTESVGSPVC